MPERHTIIHERWRIHVYGICERNTIWPRCFEAGSRSTTEADILF